MTLHPSVAAVRLAVRRTLADLDPGDTVVVACSGGADSLALLAATVFEGVRASWQVIGATVDHGLQEGSAEHADRVVEQMQALGVSESVTARVRVEAPGVGPEAAAREARYAVLGEVAERFSARVVLLGHTLDDQAETVLLGLARGSGGRALQGMRRAFEVYRRPLLDVTRADTETACLVQGIEFWTDPQNSDDRFSRVRVRTKVLPLLEDELGPGIAATLARTADQLRADTTYLDAVAAAALESVRAETGLSVQGLAPLPEPIRTRVLRAAAVEAGALGAELFHGHVLEIDRLVTAWHGQKWVDLPGHLRAVRRGGSLVFETVS
ncbi:MAG: tRNA(Ile)-lysidine synthetase [Marmoricola sp.]|jgi:tRNA(Ile)-lysidine synthase|nr:tRNA(Ile)-lysidine synthetase [Marmoricola sp.]